MWEMVYGQITPGKTRLEEVQGAGHIFYSPEPTWEWSEARETIRLYHRGVLSSDDLGKHGRTLSVSNS